MIYLLPFVLAGPGLTAPPAIQAAGIKTSPWEKEIVYQIFPRSFADSNGDRIGDFKGIQGRLGYIKSLGATAILLQPILASRLYHNYFPDSFMDTDPKFGTNQQFFDLVHACHRAHIKVIVDMEEQYVASLHPWYVAAEKDPNGPDGQKLGGSGVYGLRAVPSYDGSRVPIATVNTNNPDVVKGITDSFMYWVAPPGREQDGVDGFRLDHMMDDLDSKHTNVQMLTRFWSPLEAAVRAKKPNTFFVAEQSDWGLGHDQFEKGAVDAVYAIPLRFVFLKALVSALKISPPYQPGDLAKAYREEQAATPPGKTQLVFVENHDLPRYASQVNNDPNLLRLGAVFLLTAKGTPSIYYGQELGMLGSQVKGHNDGNDIPVRLAMPWTDHHTDPGIAVWYVDGPWTTPGYSKDGDGISVESEDRDPNSLLNFYRLLIRIRKSSPALSEGSEEYSNVTDSLIDLIRESRRQRVRVLINLADRALEKSDPRAIRDVLTGERIDPRKVLAIAPHGFRLIEESLPTAAN